MEDTKMIFGDLSASLNELKSHINSPASLRRSFGRFLTLSQQLTETMRKEFSSIGGKWEASRYTGWDEYTNLFKILRRTDFHELPVVINVRERQHYLNEIWEDEQGNLIKKYIVAETVWGLADPAAEYMPGDMKLLQYDEDMNLLEDEKPELIEYEFTLRPRTEEVSNAIERAGTDNVLLLSEKCHERLEKYFDFYREEYRKQLNRE